jgi:HSP20 family protein
MAQKNKGNKERNDGGATRQASEQRNLPAQANEPSRMPAARTHHPLSRLREELDTLFDRFFSNWPAPFEWGRMMPDRFWDVDMQENDKEIIVRAEAPGFEPKDFDIQISGDTLVIQAEHQQESEDKDKGYRYSERRWGHFQRSIPLPGTVNADQVDARYRNGVLELHMPRTEDPNRKRIEVKA